MAHDQLQQSDARSPSHFRRRRSRRQVSLKRIARRESMATTTASAGAREPRATSDVPSRNQGVRLLDLLRSRVGRVSPSGVTGHDTSTISGIVRARFAPRYAARTRLADWPNCGALPKIIAAIEDRAVIVSILAQQRLHACAPPLSPARRVNLFQAA